MKQIFIRGKLNSLKRVRWVTKKVVYENNFEIEYRRGEFHIYFSKHISVRDLELIAQGLNLRIVKLSNVRAILDVC